MRRLSLLLLAPAVCLAVACSSTAALRDGRYHEVTPDQIHRAGDNDDPRVAAALRALLDRRLAEGAGAITDEQAVEAVLALGRGGDTADGPLLLRVLRMDESADVRAFAAGALADVDPGLLDAERASLLAGETDPLVRGRLQARP